MRVRATPDIMIEDLVLDDDEHALEGLFYENKKIEKYLNNDFERVAETSLQRLTPYKEDGHAKKNLKIEQSVL